MKKEIFLKRFEEALQTAISSADLSSSQRHGAIQSIPKCIAVLSEILRPISSTTELTNQHLEECKKAIAASGNLGWHHPQGITGMATKYAHTALVKISKGMSGHKNDPALVAVFKETKDIFTKWKYNTSSGAVVYLDPSNTMAMVSGTHAYRSGLDGSLKQLDVPVGVDVRVPKPSNHAIAPVATVAQVMPIDSLAAAKTLLDQGMNPLILNMANKIGIGGGVEAGSPAQEEDIFRCTNNHLALYPFGKQSPHDGRFYYDQPIHEFGSVYTPGVTVIRDREKNGKHYELRDVPFTVSCIAVAGYNLGKPDYRKELAGTRLLQKVDAGTSLLDAFEEFTEAKIKHILEIAIFKGHDSVVLGALSCGAFRYRDPVTGEQENKGITAMRVAKACGKVLMLPEYKHRFKNITFAILPLGASGQQNVDIFTDMVKRVSFVRGIAHYPVVAPMVHGAAEEVKESVEEREAREWREVLALSAREATPYLRAALPASYHARVAPMVHGADAEVKESVEAREARELLQVLELSKQEVRMHIQAPALPPAPPSFAEAMIDQQKIDAVLAQRMQEEWNSPDQVGAARSVILSVGRSEGVSVPPPPSYEQVAQEVADAEVARMLQAELNNPNQDRDRSLGR